MTFIKEYVEHSNPNIKRFIIRQSNYGKTLWYLLELGAEAEKDFPNQLSNAQIEVMHYGGDRYKGTYGIEFDLNTVAPKDYEKIAKTELIL